MKKPILICPKWLPFNLRGFCFPPFVGVRRDMVDVEWCLRHELAHWVQFKRYGWIGYFIGYLVLYLIYGYDLHPWELEARRRGWRPRSNEKKA